MQKLTPEQRAEIAGRAAAGWRDCRIASGQIARVHRSPLFPLFYHVEIRHRQLLQKQKAPLAGQRSRDAILQLP